MSCLSILTGTSTKRSAKEGENANGQNVADWQWKKGGKRSAQTSNENPRVTTGNRLATEIQTDTWLAMNKSNCQRCKDAVVYSQDKWITDQCAGQRSQRANGFSPDAHHHSPIGQSEKRRKLGEVIEREGKEMLLPLKLADCVSRSWREIPEVNSKVDGVEVIDTFLD